MHCFYNLCFFFFHICFFLQDDFHGSQVFTIATSGAESEIHSEDGRNEIEDYLTVIAKGRPTDHFYISDDEANPSLVKITSKFQNHIE